MSEHEEKKYVIKRVKKIKKSGHHGGSWKIAYADFVTAMMAFFLLMWLLSLLNKYQLQGVAEYFKRPLKAAFTQQADKNGRAQDKDKDRQKDKATDKDKNKDKSTQQTTQQQKIQAIKNDLQAKLDKNPELKQFKNQLNFIVTADGLKIQLRDLENRSMFTTGKADFENYSKTIISWLSHILNTYPNHVMIIGHTDSAQYQSTNYTNWELSADRANATRRELIRNGMGEDKIMRVVGVGDSQPLDKYNGLNPSNRRIDIIVLSDDALQKMVAQ